MLLLLFSRFVSCFARQKELDARARDFRGQRKKKNKNRSRLHRRVTLLVASVHSISLDCRREKENQNQRKTVPTHTEKKKKTSHTPHTTTDTTTDDGRRRGERRSPERDRTPNGRGSDAVSGLERRHEVWSGRVGRVRRGSAGSVPIRKIAVAFAVPKLACWWKRCIILRPCALAYNFSRRNFSTCIKYTGKPSPYAMAVFVAATSVSPDYSYNVVFILIPIANEI